MSIKHKREKNGAIKGKILTIVDREIAIVVKEGDPDPASNSRLRDVVAKVKTNNVPDNTINSGTKKAAGGLDSTNYEQNAYEGYGPPGIAIVIKTPTGDKNRTTANVRAAFSKDGGNAGTPGYVLFMSDHKRQIIINKEEYEMDPSKLMMFALGAGVEDFADNEDNYEMFTDSEQFSAVRGVFEQKSIPVLEVGVKIIPQNWVSLKSEGDQKKIQRILDLLDEDDDIQAMFYDWDEE